MLNVTATNFGVSPESVHLEAFLSDSLVILLGEIAIDTTAEEYQAVRYLKLTVANLPFSKSRETTAFAMVEVDGVKHATLAKVRITDRNTVRIDKVTAYHTAASYRLQLCSAFIPTCIVDDAVFPGKTSYEPEVTLGGLTGAECFAIGQSGWMMLVLKTETVAFDEETGTAKAVLPDFPASLSLSFPLLYNETVFDAMGSKFYPATIEGGVLTVSRDGADDEPDGTGYKFTRIFIVK